MSQHERVDHRPVVPISWTPGGAVTCSSCSLCHALVPDDEQDGHAMWHATVSVPSPRWPTLSDGDTPIVLASSDWDVFHPHDEHDNGQFATTCERCAQEAREWQ